MNTPLKLIVGLGNPGAEYSHTRHNAGANFVAELARQYHVDLTADSKFFGLTGRIRLANHDLWLLIPTTFMNRSGTAIAAMAQFYKLPPAAMLVAHDELYISVGTARLKIGGGHGGHNGLRDTIKHLANNNNFPRLRIGIDHPGKAQQVSAYVLGKPPANEQQHIDNSIYQGTQIIPLLAQGKWNEAMKTLHSK